MSRAALLLLLANHDFRHQRRWREGGERKQCPQPRPELHPVSAVMGVCKRYCYVLAWKCHRDTSVVTWPVVRGRVQWLLSYAPCYLPWVGLVIVFPREFMHTPVSARTQTESPETEGSENILNNPCTPLRTEVFKNVSNSSRCEPEWSNVDF